MSSVARIAAQAANTLVKPLNVEDVFSTYLYTGTSTTNTINNGVDLSGEGGLLWIKNRDNAQKHVLFDTERGKTKMLQTNDTSDELTNAWLDSFNSNGFSIASGVSNAEINNSAYDYASWTFRKAPKFFDVVTYTGDGTSNRQISHNLGSVPGCVMVKRTDSASTWIVYHRGVAADPETDYLRLDTTSSAVDLNTAWNDTAPTSTDFTVGSVSNVNASGGTYVAYLFAHNNGDGNFGPNGDADIIKCGSYTGNQTSYPEIDLGFEPQWVMIKRTDSTSNWYIFDSMRGIADGGTDAWLAANLTGAESNTTNFLKILPNGFALEDAHDLNLNGANFIYIAIRRGPMAVPESATDVFDVGDASETGSTAPEYEGGFTVDMALKRIQSASQSNYVFDRLRGGQSLITNGTSAESAFGAAKFDYMDGYYNGTSTSSANWSAMWRRAPNYFDVVAYTGNGTAGRNISHNLGVAPEMLWVKRRNSVSNWSVYHSGVGNTKYLVLNTTNAAATFNYWNNTDPTATTFGVSSSGAVNASGDTYIAYLFATLAGVSKVGSYTGSASAQTIDCGFTAGARFVLIKRTDSTGSWVVWDTNRGIVAGNDPYFKLETNAAPTTTDDIIDPHNSGFTLAGGVGFINTSGGSYIFYAIA